MAPEIPSKIVLRDKAAHLKSELRKTAEALEAIRLRVEEYAKEAERFEAVLYEGHLNEYELLRQWLEAHSPGTEPSIVPPEPVVEEKRSLWQQFKKSF